MKRLRHELKLLLLFFLVLTAVTVLSYLDFSTEKTVVIGRSIASVEKQLGEGGGVPVAPVMAVSPQSSLPHPTKKNESNVIKANIFCPDETPLFRHSILSKKSKQSLVMLNLNVCEDLKSSRHIWIKNQTNGFKAQVFKMGDKSYRTDFIQLNSGINKMSVEAVLKDGQKRVQALQITSGL